MLIAIVVINMKYQKNNKQKERREEKVQITSINRHHQQVREMRERAIEKKGEMRWLKEIGKKM